MVILALVAVFVFLMMDLNTRLSELARKNDQLSQVQTEVRQLERTEEALEQRVAYVTSEAAVEAWARDQGHMARPGDVVVIPMPQEGELPTFEATPLPTIAPVENWEIWQVLILGQ
jgi:cell division protein FtsB